MVVPLKIAVLSGGIGGARFLKGLRLIPNVELAVIVNSGDDITIYDLRVCPDIDSVIYNLAGIADLIRGWGRADETWATQEELEKYLGVQPWFNIGDKDFATHIFRTQLLRRGMKLHEIVEAQCATWKVKEHIIPATNEEVETHVQLDQPLENRSSIHFQEWWVRFRASLPANGFVLSGKDEAIPAPGVLEAIHNADLIILPPSNPIVSIGMILEIPGIKEALGAAKAPIVGISPIIGGNPVLGMADKCLTAMGMETSATSVSAFYGSRKQGGLLDGWLIADSDFEQCVQIERSGIACKAIPLLMNNDLASKMMAVAAINLAMATSPK